jgi:DNA-binding MarR family transcriptional regulator
MDIARQLGVNASAITRQLNDMEKSGLVLRAAHAQDSRRSHARLSAKGLRMFEEMHQRSHKLEQALAKSIGHAEMTAAADVLARLRSFIETLPPGGID